MLRQLNKNKQSESSPKQEESESNQLFQDPQSQLLNQSNKQFGQELQYVCSKSSKNSTNLIIFVSLVLITLVLYVSMSYKDIIKSIILKLDLVQIQKHSKDSQSHQQYRAMQIVQYQNSLAGISDSLLHFCPNRSTVFQVYYNQSDKSMNNLSPNIKKKSSICKVAILGYRDLKQLKAKWNLKYPQSKIVLDNLQSNTEKQKLLALLKLYFSAGTFVNTTISFQSIGNRAWSYVLTGFDMLFIDYSQITSQNIYVPNADKFMKVRYPYSNQVKIMIQKLIAKQDFLSDCRKKQCLIVKDHAYSGKI